MIADTDGRTQLFGYDPAGQLVNAADTSGDRGYTYDPAGRLTGETNPRGPRSYAYDAAGQLQTVQDPDGQRRFRYDAAGRRTGEESEDLQCRYRWDGFGRLAGIDTTADGVTGSTTLRVDALGELAQVGDTPLAWDRRPVRAAGRARRPGRRRRRPPVGSGRRGHRRPPVPDPDWQHSVSGGGDPWGAATNGIGLGYRGELVVDGLVWLRARAYDPGTRAFLDPDPLPAVPGTPVAGNPYHYAGNNPINSLDPLGLRPVTDAELEGHRDNGGGLLSSIGHGILDVAGLVPVVGEAADFGHRRLVHRRG